MKPAVATLLVFLLLASAALLLVVQQPRDPLAPYRASDGSLHIPGRALTPELQHILFGGNDLQPFFNLTYFAPARSSYATADLVPRSYLTPNPNVFVHPSRPPETLAAGIGHLVERWFPPIDWGAAMRGAAGWFFGLFTWDARATATVDTTTVTDISAAANTCTTSQTTGATDNAVLVLLSERGTTAFLSVTYGSASLTLVASTAANGGTFVRTEIWGFAGTLPAGVQTMTATLSGATTARMTCATVLLQGVKATGSFINGTSNTANSTNATISFTSAITTGNLGFAVLALQNTGGAGTQPSAVTGTGATATDLYGVATGHCTGSGAGNECAAGADLPNPGTAITWTNPATQWVASAVEVVAIPTCGTVGGGNCYRIGNNGTWTNTSNWSNTPGGASCGCAPLATDIAIFNATPTGTTTLAGATTIAALDMTGFTGTLDATNANNWPLTVNGNFTIQGTYLPRGSTVTVAGNVTVVGAATVVTLNSSAWTVNGTWTNNSTSATWSAGSSTVTIREAASGTLTFANLAGGTNEFNNLTLDASVAAGLTYTMATNPLRLGGTLLLQNSAAGATGPTLLDTSPSNLAVTTGALTVAAWGALNTESSAVTVNGNVNVSAATGSVANAGGAWTVTGSWRDTSTSASWSFVAPITFRSGAAQTMTFGAQAGNEFGGAVTFDTTAAAGVTYTMATNPLDLGGVLTVQNTAGGATGPVILDTSAGNLAVTAGGLTESALGAFNTRASTITLNGDATIGATSAYITNTGGTWAITGLWTDRTTSASWSFAAAVTFRAAASKTMTFTGSNLAGNEFGGAVTFDTTATGGVTYTMAAGATGDASLKIGGALTIRNTAAGATAATILDTSAGSYNLNAGSLTLGNPRGALRSEGSVVTISGAVLVSDANSYLVLGSAAWTVAGSWTNNTTDSADWSAGTGTLTFRAPANATMAFANLGANEANNVVFNTTTAAGMTYTMATNGLRVAGTLTVVNTAATPTGNTVLTTGASNLPLTSGGLVLGSRGTLSANGSTITVNGSWTSTAANHVWNKGTSTVVFGASGTLTMSAGESFNILTQNAGTTTLGSNVTVSGATSVNGTLDTSGSNFTLTLQSTLSIGASGVLNLEAGMATTSGNVTIAAGGAVRFTGAGTWTINGSWTNSNISVPASWSVSSSTVRIVDSGATTLTFWTATGSEFNNLVLDSSVAGGFTYAQVNALQAAGTLTVQNTAAGATGVVALDATATNYGSTLGGLSLGALGAYTSRGAAIAANGNVSVAASGYITSTGAGAWTVTGSWTNATTSASWSFSAPITFRSASSQTMTFKASGTEFGGAVTFDTTAVAGVTYTMAANGLTLSGLLSIRNSVVGPTGNTILDTSGANLGIAAGSVTIGTNGTLRANGSTISVGGNWTVTAANATFTAGTSTVAFTAAAAINMTQAFNNLTVSAGTATLAANTTVTATLTVSAGLLAKGTFALAAGALTLSGGALTSTSGSGTVTGNVSISSPASYIAFGSETWTIGGSWTNLSTSASWSAGTGTILFNDAAAATMTFAGTNLAGNEFNNLTLDSAAAAGVAYTMATNGLRIGGTLLIQNSVGSPTGNVVLLTSGLAVTAGAVTVGIRGTLSAGASTITMGGNWTVTAANATFAAGTSTVIFVASATVNMTQSFYAVTVTAGTVNAGSNLTASNALTISGGTFAKSTATLSAASLTLSGGALTSTSGNVTISGNVSVTAATSYISFGSETWTISGSWTNASTSASWNPGSGTVLFNATSAQTMTFAGSNLSGNELNNVTFNSGPSAVTFTLAARGMTIAGTLTLGGASATTLNTGVSNLAISATALNVVAGGALTANGSTITITSIDTHLGTFNAGTSTVVVNASGGTVNLTQTANNLTVNPGISTAFSGPLTWSGTLTLTSATIGFGANSLTSSGPATLTFASATITMSTGSWDTSSATVFIGTGSSVTFSGTGSLNLGAGAALAAVTISGGTRTLLGPLTANGLLTLSGGTLAKGANALTANAGLTLSGGALTSTSGAVGITGNVTVSAASSYITFGSETWTVSGSWTNNSTSASWSAGTATVVFISASSQTMRFASLPGGAAEFYNLTFNGGAATVTFTMAGNAAAWTGTLTIQGGSGTTTLATSSLGLTGGTVNLGNGGILTANASAVSVTDVSMVGGTSGTITVTTGPWNVSGSWDTSGAGSTFTAGTSTMTFLGTSTTIRLSAGQAFYNLTIGGAVSLASAVTALATLSIADGAVMTKTGQSVTFNALAENGTGSVVDGIVTVVNLTITNSDPTNLTTVSVFSVWALDGEFRWTDASTVATSTLAFTIGGNTSGYRFNVTKDGTAFTTGMVDGSGQVVFTMLGSDSVVDVIIAAPCGGTRYWVGGAGNWSDSAHWSATSGGAGGCPAPNGASATLFDANSGGGTVTVDQNATMASLNTSGWTGTIAVGTFNFTIGGNLTLAGGNLTVGTSAGTGLTVTGNLTVSGTAVLDGSGAASLVSIGGNTSITSATAYFRMGSGTWTFSGSWSNGSTSANWGAGTGTVVFNSATPQTMSLGGFSGKEFNNVTFASTAVSGAVTFTIGANSLKWSGTLTIQDPAGSITTLATADLALAGGSLTVGNSGILTADASAVAVADVTMTGGASGRITMTTGSWTVSGNWDTSGSGSTFTKGTGAVTMSGTARTLTILDPTDGFYSLTISGTVTQASAIDVSSSLAITGTLTTAGNNVTGGASLVISGGGALVGTIASISVSAVTMNDPAADMLSLTTGSITVSGSWDTSGPASTFSSGTSTVTLTAPSGTIALGAAQSFATLNLSGAYTQTTQLSATSLTLSAGGLAKGGNPLTVDGDLTLAGGYLTSASGDVTITGNVDISAATSYIAFGSEAWTVSGSWTNGSTSASWSAGTGSVAFDAASSQTMTFAGTNLAGPEFNAVVFNGGASTVVFTLTGSALQVHTLTVQGGSGTTTVTTAGSDLPITADTLAVRAGGALLANGSVLTIRAMDTSAGAFTAGSSVIVVNASGGTIRVPQPLNSLTVNPGITTTFTSNITWSSVLNLTGATVAFQDNLTSSGAAALSFASATISVGGSWDTSSATAFTSTGSSATFTGAGTTITLGAGQQFATLTIAGAITLASAVTAMSLIVNASGILTMTGYRIAFNSLTVNGTIAYGTVNVTGLTVTNSDTTALVTISAFTSWNPGSEYAWTHTSSETSQTITWTIGGNTSRFLYHVTKDSSDFADGTVNDSGDIVLTMTGSDPDVRVTVSAPPIPPWWQSPYFLAIPPIGLLMVVAMFVQRRRWRPTKAFLVDERGQLLREFTLDPSCEVTYDQALQAGALNAVEKDVRVSKYHARAVRGDMLSLIVLAVGPADVGEVEFARGLLVSIQDKLEDRVKQRVEEARAEETTLENDRADANESRADLQARARVFGDMVNAFTIARTKMDTDAVRLRRLDTDLREREGNLAEVRATLEEQAAHMEARQAELDSTAADLESQRTGLQETEQGLRERETSLAPKEKELTGRLDEASKREADLADKDQSLAAAQTKLTADLEDYRAKADQVDALQAELAEERKSLDDLSVQIDQEEESLKATMSAVEAREKETADAARTLQAKLSDLEPREQSLAAREAELSSRDSALALREDVVSTREKEIRAQLEDLHSREAALATRAQDLADERKALDDLTLEAVEERKAIDAKTAALAEQEADVTKKTQDLTSLKENLGPREAALVQKEDDLAAREKALAEERNVFQGQQDLVAAKALEIEQQMEQMKERETALAQEKMLLQDARGAFDAEHQELEAKKAEFAQEMQKREAQTASQERTLGEARMRLTKDNETFEALRLEKSQWIASKEIELEAKEQGQADREAEIRGQAEENARRLSELAAREETLEIEADKLEKARAEVETRKAELGAMTRDFEGKTAKFRDEEARKAEELRTWQATIESEQALLKEQRETFEKEMQDLRESWAGRMIRVEQREEELGERETKVQADVEWVARNETELVKREKLATEGLRAASALKAEGERLHTDLEQRSLEIESRERSLREEAANQAVDLEKRVETLQTQEAELAGRKAQSERELATQTQKVKDREAELLQRKGELDVHEADLVSREAALVSQQSALRADEDRLAREKIDYQAMEKQVEARQLELGQTRERLDAESLRLRTETDAVRQSLAAKEADLLSERERLERESSALQEKLGGKAKEMAAREKSLAAREEELRSEEQDLETRIREIESRERQAEAQAVEIAAREQALAHGEQEQNARRTQFDETVQKFEAEAIARQQEWKDLQATLKSQEAQLAASTETRQSEIRKRMEDLEQRERSVNATLTQAQIERTRLEDQAKGQGAKQAEIDASAARADKRFGELKAMEDELLKTRQTFESEKAGWSARRNEELKQLEATRDAAGEQTQQAERLIEEAQRRAYVAAEAEKAAKRQGDELATAQTVLERRRADAEKAEKDLEAQNAQLRDAAQRLGEQEIELGSRAKELGALQARLSDAEKKTLETTESLKGRKTALDQEAERIGALAAQLDKRQAEDESRHAAVEAKLVDVTTREQVLSTELQRADNLMEDLNRKEAELVTREKGVTGRDQELAKREATLSQRDAELREGMQTLERLRREHEARAAQVDEDHRVASEARKDAEGIRTDAEKLKTQADAMQAEVAKNMRFLQKKALDVLDREEKLRGREVKVDEQSRLLESRAQILDQKDRAMESEKEELTARIEKAKQENDKLRAKLVEAEKSGKSTIDMDEWKRDVENRVKIIQKKALDLLDREEKLRKKEEELKALAAQLGVEAKS